MESSENKSPSSVAKSHGNLPVLSLFERRGLVQTQRLEESNKDNIRFKKLQIAELDLDLEKYMIAKSENDKQFDTGTLNAEARLDMAVKLNPRIDDTRGRRWDLRRALRAHEEKDGTVPTLTSESIMETSFGSTLMYLYKILMTLPQYRGHHIGFGKRLGEANGNELHFRMSFRPAKRFLFYYFTLQRMVVRRDRKPGWEKFWTESANMWPLQDKYLVKSMLKPLSEACGDTWSEEDFAPLFPNFDDTGPSGLEADEEIELWRRMLDAEGKRFFKFNKDEGY